MRRDAAAAAAMEGLQERILDLNDKLRHATLPLSAGRGAPAGRGCVIPKGRRGRGDRCSAVVAGARSLHAIRAALEDLEGHLHCLRDVIVQQQVKRGAAISRLQQSRYHAQYITRSYGDRGNIHDVPTESQDDDDQTKVLKKDSSWQPYRETKGC
ncbi:uncharacterized protein LOC133919026 isoform X5 [Phragmites australis]|uniref:uncharacterized protein LOC133919026 isoform X5 n=1 Tax=Phragmites australis TaxID=29695 RepID=UPI002D76A068|nr:uncharacterized protein LOC133919026 isoform X5 [Phragmites australis]